ncbi:hypothetical protein ACTXP3_26900, partial [Klebsiella pneumoniae]|uniref:hypothetical protein n=1 Tax=Klebsiella pneumoniae TaxID=573 RepID=UPI003FD22E48
VEGAPFTLYCDGPLRAVERTGDRALILLLDGGDDCVANLRVVRSKRRTLSRTAIATAAGDTIRPYATSRDRIDYRVPAMGRLILTWE